MVLNPFSSLQPLDSGSEQIVQAKPAALDEAVEKAYLVYTGLEPTEYLTTIAKQPVSGLEKQILLPGQIDGLLQMIISETEQEKVNNSVTGLYLTRLIQDSYDAGYNGFVLTTRDTHIDAIGYELSGSEEKRLKIRIDGNAGDDCGFDANYSEIAIYGNAGDGCGQWASSSEITIYGNAGDGCGEWASSSEITIYGNAGDDCGFDANYSEIAIYGNASDYCGFDANYSEITIYGNAGDDCGFDANYSEIAIYGNASDYCGYRADNTIFTAYIEQAYHMFKKYVQKGEGNTIRLADSSGKILKEEHL